MAHHPMRIRFICRFGSVALGCIGFGLTLSGCGNVLYTYRANSASTKLEEARQAGAEKTALYEYTLAREHLNKAMSEASQADYGDAYDLAQLADDYAEQAAEKAKRRLHSQSKPHAAPNDAPPSESSNSSSGEAEPAKDSPRAASGSNTQGEQK